MCSYVHLYSFHTVILLPVFMIRFFSPIGCVIHHHSGAYTIFFYKVHQDNFRLNVKLQLFALIAKQPTFHQLRTVEQLGYITVLIQRFAN